jgi:radical SAM superfamily enzyme YgiQ (UPF0313 family)
MKVLLIAVPLMDRVKGELRPIAMDRIKANPPLGVYWLAAVLRNEGYEVDVLDLIALGTIDSGIVAERAVQADMVGVSCNSLNWPSAKLVVDSIKREYPALPVIVGGIHPSGWPEHVLRSCKADFVILGEGEEPLVRFLDAYRNGRKYESVPGLGWWADGQVKTTPNAGLATSAELERLPDPAYDLLPAGIYESLSIESARGCKFRCTFCSTKFLGSWRAISTENFVNRLERMLPYVKKVRYGVFAIIDDLFTLDIDRVPAVSAEILRRRLPVQATLDARATDVIRGDVCEALAPITNHMLIGAECGYDEGLRRIRKACTTAVLERAASMLQQAGLSERCVFSFVIGFPFETAADCRKTVEFASKLLLKYNVRIYLQWYNTIPGSAIWSELETEGSVRIEDYDDFGFFQSARLFRAGVRLPLKEIQEISDTIRSINTLLLLTQPASDIIQFSAPETFLQGATLDFPSHGVLEGGLRPPPGPDRSDVAGLVGLRGRARAD